MGIRKQLAGFAVLVLSITIIATWASPAGAAKASKPRLQFVYSAQPGDAVAGDTISSVDFDPNGAAVAVQVIDQNGNVKNPPNLTVSLAIGSDPCATPGTLSGVAPVVLSDGTITFPGISIDVACSGYTLVASAGTTATARTSDPFNVVGERIPCPNGTCDHSADNGTTFVDLSASTTGGFLTVTVGDSMPLCAGYGRPTSAVISFNYSQENTSAAFKTVTITIDKSLVNLKQANAGVNKFQVCFLGDGETTPHLLPDCLNPPSNVPCVLSKSRSNAGDVILTYLAAPGDPKSFG